MRLIHRFIAWIGGYFWLPCDACGREFGGHEHAFTWPSVVVLKDEHAMVACPACAARAIREGIPPTNNFAIVLQPMQFAD